MKTQFASVLAIPKKNNVILKVECFALGYYTNKRRQAFAWAIQHANSHRIYKFLLQTNNNYMLGIHGIFMSQYKRIVTLLSLNTNQKKNGLISFPIYVKLWHISLRFMIDKQESIGNYQTHTHTPTRANNHKHTHTFKHVHSTHRWIPNRK